MHSFWLALRAPEFWLQLVATVAAMFHVPWWITVPLVVAGLSITSLPKYIAMWPSAHDVGAERQWLLTVGLSTIVSFTAAFLPHFAGIVTRWLWF